MSRHNAPLAVLLVIAVILAACGPSAAPGPIRSRCDRAHAVSCSPLGCRRAAALW